MKNYLYSYLLFIGFIGTESADILRDQHIKFIDFVHLMDNLDVIDENYSYISC